MANKGLGVRRKIFIGAGVFALLLGILYVHLAVYPFWSDHPNFSDVERVFDRIQFPEDWKITESGEDRGIAGRTCPLEGSGCFSKYVRYMNIGDINKDTLGSIIKTSGCGSVSFNDNTIEGEVTKKYYFSCSTEGISINGDFKEGEYVFVSSQSF